MSATNVNGTWFEPTRRRLLDGGTLVTRLMTTSAEVAALDIQWPRHPSVSILATVREAAHLMAKCGLHQVQVRNQRGDVVGVLSASDLFRWVAGEEDERERHGQA